VSARERCARRREWWARDPGAPGVEKNRARVSISTEHDRLHHEARSTTTMRPTKAKKVSTVSCNLCRAVRDEDEWLALPRLARVAGDDLAYLVRRWPDGVVVDVRACTCGAAIARLVCGPRARVS
jgi:hypothetical protein